MSRSIHFIRTTVVAVTLALVAASTSASAQRRPRVGFAGQAPPPPPQISTPYPGATVTIDPRLYQQRQFPLSRPPYRQRLANSGYYVPMQSGYPYYPPVGGGVTDANGRPLYIESESAPASSQGGYGFGTPDFSGSPYVAVPGGAMVVDFGNGDRRTIPSCAAGMVARAPNGQPRTIFFRPGSEGVILRDGQRGRVIGTPGAGARTCYTSDEYGRMVLDY